MPTKTSELTNDSNYAEISYVDQKVADLVDSAPEALNTLNEFAQALGNDENFATTVTTEIGKKASKEEVNTALEEIRNSINEIPEQVQADWNQSDETAPDFVKNKPFGQDGVIVYSQTGTCYYFAGDYTLPLTERQADLLNGVDSVVVVLNGESYECEVEYSEADYTGSGVYYAYYTMGNKSLKKGSTDEDTGEPFLLSLTTNPGGDVITFRNYMDYDYKVIIGGTGEILTLDEKFIPESIARVSDVESTIQEAVASIPEQVQADWNQNDETAADYIKNRTHYAEKVLTPIVEDLSGARVIGHEGSYILVDGYIIEVDGVKYTISRVLVDEYSDYDDEGMREHYSYEYFGNPAVYPYDLYKADIVHDVPFFMYHEYGTYTGIYFGDEDTHTVNVYSTGGEIVHQLDEKFIPDTIARQADVDDKISQLRIDIGETIDAIPEQVQADWNVNDETAPDYIKNKPFYEGEIKDVIFDVESEIGKYNIAPINIVTDTGLHINDWYDMLGVIESENFRVEFDGIVYDTYEKTVIDSQLYPGVYYDTRYGFMDEFGEEIFYIYLNGQDGSTDRIGWYDTSISHRIRTYTINNTIVQLDEKFIPDTITRDSELHAIAKSGSWNDLIDKPFGEEISLTEVIKDMSVTTNRGGYMLYDSEMGFPVNPPTIDGTESFYIKIDGKNYKGVYSEELNKSDGSSITGLKFIKVQTENGSVIYALDEYTVSVYYDDGFENSSHVVGLYTSSEASVKQLDEKFIPDTIARKSDMPKTRLHIWTEV